MPTRDQIRATGGGSRSDLWRRILADVLGRGDRDDLHRRGRGAGRRDARRRRGRMVRHGEDACARLVRIGEPTEPSGDADAYADAYARYRDLYPALAPTFHATLSR